MDRISTRCKHQYHTSQTYIHVYSIYMCLQRCFDLSPQCILNVNTCIHVLLQAIDNCPPIQTITERLVLEMIKVYIYSTYICISNSTCVGVLRMCSTMYIQYIHTYVALYM